MTGGTLGPGLGGFIENHLLDDVAGIVAIEELAELLRRLRRRHARTRGDTPLTYRELAARTGWARGVIGDYFAGKTLPPTDRFDALIRLLGASPTEQGMLATARDRVEESRRHQARDAPAFTARAARALPPDVPGFTGRASELARLDSLSHGEGEPATAVIIATITGPPGVGKTAFAVHWAHRVRRRFPDGQLYANLRGYGPGAPPRPVEVLAGFLPALGVPAEQVPPDVDAAAGLYRTLLADRRVLVLLDNVGDPDQISPLLPGDPGCLVLLTSRDRLDGMTVHNGATRLVLDVLTPAECVCLLERLLGVERVRAEPYAAAGLATLCGHLPLALRIAAANLSTRPDRLIADYNTLLAGGDRLSALRVTGDVRVGVPAAFSHSYSALPAGARRLFRLLGVIPNHDLTVEVAAALADVAPARAATQLDLLASAHLVNEQAPGRYTLHELLRLYATRKATAEDDETDRAAALGRLHDHYLRFAGAAAALLYPHVLRLPEDDGTTLSSVDDRDRALASLDAERPNLVAVVTHAAEQGQHSVAWRLADALAGYLCMRMSTIDWLAVANAGLSAAEHAANPMAQAASHLSLATLARATGDYRRAIEHYARSRDLATRAGWPDCVASALSNLGIVCWATGQPEAAIAHYTRALELNRRTGRLAGQAANLRRLGLAHWGLGRLEESAGHLTSALALHRRMASRSGEARTLCGLGEAYRALGRLDDASVSLAQALELYRQFGDRNRETDTLRVLAAVHRDAGRHGTALEVASAALALARETGNRPNEADALNTHGTILDRLGRHGEAVGDHQRALQLARNAGNRYTETEALIGLAEASHHAGDHAHATDYATAALACARRNHFRLLEGDALVALAASVTGGDRAHLAAGHVERALAMHTEAGYPLGQARAHQTAAVAMSLAGRHDDAQAHLRQAATLLDRMGVDQRTLTGAAGDHDRR